jgi:hypothetical protein
VHIDALGPGVENAKVLLHFANASHGGLEHSLDEQALLGVHDLVVTVFEFAEDVNVLDVQASQVLEDFVFWPRFNVGLACFVLFGWHVLDFDLLK